MNAIRLSVAVSLGLLAGCQGHLPALETAPKESGPKTADIINHIACEIGTVVNYPPADGHSPLNERIRSRAEDKAVAGYLHELRDYHFVATAQISLEVTDAEGFAPSLAYLNKSGQLTVGLGGQLNGTQDRSLTLNYAIDLHDLTLAQTAKYCQAARAGIDESVSQKLGLSGAIAGDLGLADIISDGLIAMHTSADTNIYGSSGPVPPVILRDVNETGTIVVPPIASPTKERGASKEKPERHFHIDALKGIVQFSPQAPGAAAAGTVTLAGTAKLSGGGQTANYLVNWSGSILPQGRTGSDDVYFSLTGNLAPVPGGGALSGLTNSTWGYNPTVNLTGRIAHDYTPSTLKLVGALSPNGNSDYSSAGLIAVDINSAKEEAPAGPGGGGGGVKGGASAASGAGGTSFGSLVDFVLVYGASGGPNWTFKRFKGPQNGSSALLSASRTKTDSLAITFVATCRDFQNLNEVPTQFSKYWDAIGPCDQTNSLQQQGASVGYQNNSLMILRNFLVKP